MAENKGLKRIVGGNLSANLTIYTGEITPEVLRFTTSVPRSSGNGVYYALWNKQTELGNVPVEAWYLKLENDNRIWHSANGHTFSPFKGSLPQGHIDLLKNAKVTLPW